MEEQLDEVEDGAVSDGFEAVPAGWGEVEEDLESGFCGDSVV